MTIKNCMYCKEVLGINYPYYLVKKAIKPKYSHNRWVTISYACENCIDKQKEKINYELGEEIPKKV